jgi:prepilin-type N-terminal cleavage/methylation domain-containing protein
MVTPRGLMILRGRVSSERGITLVELMVTVAIMSVVLGFVTRGFVGLQNAAAGASLRLQNLDEARILMNAVSKDLRTAARLSATSSPFDVTLPSSGPAAFAGWCSVGCTAPTATTGIRNTEVWFYANLTLGSASNPSPCPDIVHLYVDTITAGPDVLREQVVPADAGGTPPSCSYSVAPTTRLIGTYIANPATSPVFTFYYDDATGIPACYANGASPANPLCVAGPSVMPLSAANRLQVNAVGITLSVRQSTNFSLPATTLINRVRLPNVEYNPLPSPSP